MKKLFIFTLLLSSISLLQASHNQKGKKTQYPQRSTTDIIAECEPLSHSAAQPKVTIETSPPLLPAPAPSQQTSSLSSPLSPGEKLASHNFFRNESTPQFPTITIPTGLEIVTTDEQEHAATACQTTIKNFEQSTRLQTDHGVSQASNDDLDLVNQDEIATLEKDAKDNQTLAQKALETLQTVGAITQEFLLSMSCSELERIIQLDRELQLTNHLKSFGTQDQQGERLTRALNQAVELKSIDRTTRMLEIIHHYKLTNYVPAAHQDKAAELLSAQNAKTISLLLPLTQRNSGIGILSPRCKTVKEALQATRKSYGHNEDTPEEECFINEILAQIKNFKPVAPTTAVTILPDKK